MQLSNVVAKNSIEEDKDSIHIIKRLNEHFRKYGVQGSITLYDNSTRIFITSDSIDSKRQTFPASTFKIINLLIALETGVIKNEKEIIKWTGKIPDTTLYGYRPEIYHDMSVKQAFTVSAGWVFAELAKKIGEDKYRRYLNACNYGNLQYSANGLEFWNFGPLQISPFNQVQFLKRVYEGTVPFSRRNLEILKDLMVTEKTGDYIIRSKTGWSRQDDTELGWWTGYLEKEDKMFFFATRLTQPFDSKRSYDSQFGRYRKEITLNVFKDLKIIE